MSNKIHGFIRKLFQNSKLTRENFVKNKKTYNENSVKQRQYRCNKIITRRNHTYIKRPFSFGIFGAGMGGGGGGGGGGHKPSLLFILITTASVGIYNNQKK